ncbi:MAG: hypothetical protein P4L31_04550 [Candidatus Babeliales bacterium]|nr:hypothetical protein [Candidatus Babeliales bacterium]
MIKNILCFFIFFWGSNSQSTHKGVFIIVHGTWGIDSLWCKPGGEFFDELERTAHKMNKRVVSYMWPGYLNHDSRQLAAHGLAKLIKSYPAHMDITIFAHSHGGNVSIVASQILASDKTNKHTIEALYTLGTPINHTYYAPDMNVVRRVYNFFSFADRVQPVLGVFGRMFPDHPRIANIRLMVNGKEPGHLEFCTALAARWLPRLNQLVKESIGGFEKFTCSNPGIIHLTITGSPIYILDTQRNALIDRDEFIMQKVMSNLLRGKSYDGGSKELFNF